VATSKKSTARTRGRGARAWAGRAPRQLAARATDVDVRHRHRKREPRAGLARATRIDIARAASWRGARGSCAPPFRGTHGALMSTSWRGTRARRALAHVAAGAVICWEMDGFSPRRMADGGPKLWPCDAV
jgi:hypothetical protein